MADPCFVFAADWHLAEHTWIHRPEIAHDAYHGADQIVHQCTSLGVPLVLGGDIFHSTVQRTSSTVAYFGELMRRLELHDLLMYFVQGNHDRGRIRRAAAASTWPTAVAPNAVHLEGMALPLALGPYRIVGLDSRSPGQLADGLSQLPAEANTLICHQLWSELVTNPKITPDGSLATVPPTIRRVLSGDYHQSVRRQVGWLWAYYAGSICRQAIDEVPRKYCWLFDTAGRGTRLPLRVRPGGKFTILTRAALAEFLDVLWPTWLRAIAPEQAALPPALLQRVCAPAAHLFLDPLPPSDDETAAVTRAQRRALREGGVRAALARVEADDAYRDWALRLYEAPPAERQRELDQITAELLEAAAVAGAAAVTP